MDKIFEKEHKENLRKLHDIVKDHPFWKTLSNDFHVDCMEKMKEMFDYFIECFTKESIKYSPQAIILFQCLHNIYDCMLKAKIMPKYNHMTVMEMNGFGNYVLALQTALQLVHYYLDGIFDEGAEQNLKISKYHEEKYNDLIDNKEKYYIIK